MNRVLVLFDSLSGNTAKMAELVAEGARSVPDTEVRVKSVAEATAGLHLVEWRERRLTGEQRPEWETDLLEFEKG
jgi:multimeric flavodoxin WrbA